VRFAYADSLISKTHMQRFFVCLRIDGYGTYAKFPAGADNSEGYFATVGDKYF
jgi:hypothetical protein